MYQILKYNLSFDTILNDMMVQQNRALQGFITNNGNNVLVNTTTAT